MCFPCLPFLVGFCRLEWPRRSDEVLGLMGIGFCFAVSAKLGGLEQKRKKRYDRQIFGPQASVQLPTNIYDSWDLCRPLMVNESSTTNI